MAHFNARPARVVNVLPYPGHSGSTPVTGDIVKILSGDLRGDLGIVQRYTLGALSPYTVQVGREEHYYNVTQLMTI